VKWLADENFDNDILRGVFGRSPGFDVVRVQDIPSIYGKNDPAGLTTRFDQPGLTNQV